MYEIFQRLLSEKGITAYRVAKETGIPQSTFTSWKNGVYSPKDEKMKKIADYLGVSVEYLRTGQEQKEKPAETGEPTDEKYIIISRNAKKMTPEQRQKLIDMAKIVMGKEFDDT